MILFEDYLCRISHVDKEIPESVIESWIREVSKEISVNTLGQHVYYIRQLLVFLTDLGYTCFIPRTLTTHDTYVPYLYSDDDTLMVSWSKSDLNQLKKETETKNIDTLWLEDKFETWIDCQKEFSEKIQADKKYNLQEALNLSDIVSDCSEHDGFSDAYNTAMLFQKIMTEEEFHTSSKYVKAAEETDKISFSLGSLLSQIRIAS